MESVDGADGVLGRDYHDHRKTKLSHRYRLQRRSEEVLEALRRFAIPPIRSMLDVGAADGGMIDGIRGQLDRDVYYAAVDLSFPLLQVIDKDSIGAAQATAEALPFAGGAFDVVVATAVIEHVARPRRFVDEVFRVLRPGGLVFVTTPSPHMEEIATFCGLLDEDQHNETFNLRQLSGLFATKGFDVLDAYKFMLSPVGMPGEKAVERGLRAVGLTFTMANQFLAARRPVEPETPS